MSRPASPIVRQYMQMYNYFKSWDIVLCVPWAEQEGVSPMHIRFYEYIENGIKSLGKTCFMPHKHFANVTNKEDFINKQEIIKHIVVPTSDLILNYSWSMGTPLSYAVINISAVGNFVPEICFIEEEKYDEVHEPGDLELILFKNHADCVEKLKIALKEFYDKGKNLQ